MRDSPTATRGQHASLKKVRSKLRITARVRGSGLVGASPGTSSHPWRDSRGSRHAPGRWRKQGGRACCVHACLSGTRDRFFLFLHLPLLSRTPPRPGQRQGGDWATCDRELQGTVRWVVRNPPACSRALGEQLPPGLARKCLTPARKAETETGTVGTGAQELALGSGVMRRHERHRGGAKWCDRFLLACL